MTRAEVIKILKMCDDVFREEDLLSFHGKHQDEHIIQRDLFQRIRNDGDERSIPTIRDAFIATMAKAFGKNGCFIRVIETIGDVYFEVLC